MAEKGRAVRILVVDDHPLIREALRQVLQALDNAVDLLEAQTGAEALELARRNPKLSLILLDLALPGADGFETLRQLREEFPGIPVVVLSAHEQSETVTRAIDGGAMGFIPKTSTSGILVQALRLVLSGGIYLPPEVLRRQSPAGSAAPVPVTTPAQLRDPHEIGLTERQSQVLALLVQGMPNKLICRELKLAEGTVKIHVTAILKSLGVGNRTQAVIAVSKLGLRLPTA
jgi:DNA-binding NarL/FixJ family response regulator